MTSMGSYRLDKTSKRCYEKVGNKRENHVNLLNSYPLVEALKLYNVQIDDEVIFIP